MVKKKIKNIRFLIIGSRLNTKIKYWRKLHNLVSSLGLQDEVIFTDFRDDIPDILSILNVFVLSSVTESGPMVVVEAMAMKIPVVATNVGGVNEKIINEKSGIVVQPCNENQLAEAILRVLHMTKDDRKKMANIAYERVEKVFSLHIIAKKHKDIYEDILSNQKI